MANLTENERGFFYEGKAATADIVSPAGQKTNSAGDKRDGGSFEERFSKVAVWNNLMDEAEFHRHVGEENILPHVEAALTRAGEIWAARTQPRQEPPAA